MVKICKMIWSSSDKNRHQYHHALKCVHHKESINQNPLGLVWKLQAPPGSLPIPVGGNPRGNIPRAR